MSMIYQVPAFRNFGLIFNTMQPKASVLFYFLLVKMPLIEHIKKYSLCTVCSSGVFTLVPAWRWDTGKQNWKNCPVFLSLINQDGCA